MDRRDTVLALLALGAAPLAAEAQQAAKVARIGYLSTNLAANPPHEAFGQGLRDLGYVEGRNVVIEYRDAEGKLERLPALAAELVALKVDVILADGGTLGPRVAMQATTTIPIVFTSAADPVGSGLVTSLARPGGNVTGLSGLNPELVGKCLEQLKHAVPGVSRIAVLWHSGGTGGRLQKDMLKEAEVAARALAMRLQIIDAPGTADFDRAFHEMNTARADAVMVLPSNMFNNERRRLADLARKNRLPAVFQFREYVDAGGLWLMEPALLI